MSFELKLAWTYFRARRKSQARFTSVVAVVGIAAGVASLILALALAQGFADEMRDKILLNTAHISISMTDQSEIFNWEDVGTELEKLDNVESVSGTLFENVVIIGKNSKSYGVFRVAPNSDEASISKSKFENKPNGPTEFESNSSSSPDKFINISLGVQLAKKVGLNIGDAAEIVLFSDDSAKSLDVRIVDTFKTGLYEFDSTWIELTKADYVKASGKLRFVPTSLLVNVSDIYNANKTAEEIRSKIGDTFHVIDWQEANQPLFTALSLERKVALAVISLIIFIAALNISTTITLLVNERKLDIAVLRTCGATAGNLIKMFMIESLLLGSIGVAIGVVCGTFGCFLGNYFRIISPPAEIYILNFVPFNPDFSAVGLTIIIALTICLAAALYPASKISRIKPLENLRTQ